MIDTPFSLEEMQANLAMLRRGISTPERIMILAAARRAQARNPNAPLTLLVIGNS